MKNYERKIYLNNAATSWPKPACVGEAMGEAVKALPGSGGRGGIEEFDIFQAVREELAEWLGISCPERIALGCNSTWGLNQGIFGFPLRPGDTVLTTRAEHNAVLRPLYRLEQQGIQVIYLDVDRTGRVSPEAWEKALDRFRPRLCVLIHASNVTGAVNDAPQADGGSPQIRSSTAAGPFPEPGMAAGGTGRLGGGSGCIHRTQISFGTPGDRRHLRAAGAGTEAVFSGRHRRAERPEGNAGGNAHSSGAGTGNEPSYHGLLAALRWSREHPREQEAGEALLRYLKEGLKRLGCLVIEPEPPVTPVVSFGIPGISPGEAGDILAGSYDIICRTGLHCAPAIMENLEMPGGTIRLSLSRFTCREELDTVLEAVEAIVESMREGA